jgi:hypothetical protein
VLRSIGFNEVIELYDAEASKDSIMSLFINQGELPDKLKPEDRLLVFFSGHGTTLKNKTNGSTSGYMIPVDAQEGKWTSMIEFDDLVQKSLRRLPARHILFLLDCCFSGIAATRGIQLDSVAIPPMPLDEYIESCTRKRAIQIITAGQDDEPVLDSSPFNGHSPFTGSLIHGIRTWEADLNKDGVMTAQELGVYLDKKVSDTANVYGHKQKPYANRLPGDEGGDFIIMISTGHAHETLAEYRNRVKSLTARQKAAMIKEITRCNITTIIDQEDILAVTYTTYVNNPKSLQAEIIALVKAIGHIFTPKIAYRIIVRSFVDTVIKIGEDIPEILTLEIPAQKVQEFVFNELDLEGFWVSISSFRKESDTKSYTISQITFDLVL